MRVEIKTWEEMLKEFDGNYQHIDCTFGMPYGMNAEFPEDRIIEVEDQLEEYKSGGINEYVWHGWSISDDMIKRIIDESSN